MTGPVRMQCSPCIRPSLACQEAWHISACRDVVHDLHAPYHSGYSARAFCNPAATVPLQSGCDLTCNNIWLPSVLIHCAAPRNKHNWRLGLHASCSRMAPWWHLEEGSYPTNGYEHQEQLFLLQRTTESLRWAPTLLDGSHIMLSAAQAWPACDHVVTNSTALGWARSACRA